MLFSLYSGMVCLRLLWVNYYYYYSYFSCRIYQEYWDTPYHIRPQIIYKSIRTFTEGTECITKTCLCNFDPMKPQFYIVKLGFTGYKLFFLFLLKNIDWGYSLEPPRRGGSNEHPQSMFWTEIRKISQFFIWFFFSVFGGEIFNIFELACFHKGNQLKLVGGMANSVDLIRRRVLRLLIWSALFAQVCLSEYF